MYYDIIMRHNIITHGLLLEGMLEVNTNLITLMVATKTNILKSGY